ncbi:MAG: transcription antitermination factor NusB [Halieaceae bacterium]|uniref:Transcription antitermination protein NusB n=1 Tax=Haliea salexigens TaxID=287487 RepID=A0A3C1KTC5_9GAMM|nr:MULTISPECIES: transcription antitermination factor NusB [Haliea]MAA86944.1 transcription antitermination factor NusB [Haliea sp.]MCR9186782.1 transcription antitermination factor NusB [Halieaceae bacterium]HAN29935.1 transcription antitermination factor NusB [Haliea salexigens]
MSKQARNTLAAERHKARHYAMQALYQWHMAEAPVSQIEAEFRSDYDFNHVDLEYFQALLHGVPGCVDELEATLAPLLDRKLDELDPIERSLLRMGIFELQQRIDVPWKVVINEAVSLAKKFGATDSHKYINGVLDKAARQLRKAETDASA